MRVAFYAPLKPPDHPVPSGDRRMARLLIQALGLAGHEVEIAARLRSWNARPDPARQARLERIGQAMAERLLRESPRLSEVAERLGFSDESAFAKAFRRWSSMTPGQFRQGLAE